MDASKATLNAASHLVGRVATPNDIAELVLYLASKEASFVNGVVWLIDGGSLAWHGAAQSISYACSIGASKKSV